MRETETELVDLQRLLDESHGRATSHLRGIINESHSLRAGEIASLMTGMRVIAVATVTRNAEPRISALDGHFLHARWVFSTSLDSAKARQLRSRPSVSVAYIEGEDVGIFTHGRAERVSEGHQDFEEVHSYLTAHYGSSPLSWGEVGLFLVRPAWMVGYAFRREELLAARGVEQESRERGATRPLS